MKSIQQVTADRAKSVEQLRLSDGFTSQWLDAANFRSCFCMAIQSLSAEWIIEGLLPSGDTIVLGSYGPDTLFVETMPRYITVNAMCGLPIRFVSSVSQPSSLLWIVFKS